MATDPKQIKAIGFDIDGVLSDGRLVPMADGDVLRILDAKDSFAVRAVSGNGLVSFIISLKSFVGRILNDVSYITSVCIPPVPNIITSFPKVLS